jgi:hypothetical protein
MVEKSPYPTMSPHAALHCKTQRRCVATLSLYAHTVHTMCYARTNTQGKNVIGGACVAYGGGERCAQGSGGET